MSLNKNHLINIFKLCLLFIFIILVSGCRRDGNHINDSVDYDANRDMVYFVSAEVDEVIRIEDGYALKLDSGGDASIVDIINENTLLAKKPGSIILENMNGSVIELEISTEKTVDFFLSRKSLVEELFYKDYLYDLSVSSVVFSDIEGIVDIEITELNNKYIEVVNSGSSESTSHLLEDQVSVSFSNAGNYNIIIKFNDREFLKVIDVTKIKTYRGVLKIKNGPQNSTDIVEGDIWIPSVTNIDEKNLISPVDREVLTYYINGDKYNYFRYLDRIRSLAPGTYTISVSSGELQSNNSFLTVRPLSEWLAINFTNISLPDKVYSELINFVNLHPYKGKSTLSTSTEGIEIYDNRIKVLDKNINDFNLTLKINDYVKTKHVFVEHGKFRFNSFYTSTNINVEQNKTTYGDRFIFSDVKNGNGYWYWLEFINLGDGTMHRLSPFELPSTERCSFRLGEIDRISISATTINTINDEDGYTDNVIDFVCSSSVDSEVVRVSDSRALEPEHKFGYSLFQNENQDVTFSLTMLGEYFLQSLPLLVVNDFNAESIPVFDFDDISISSESAAKIAVNEFGSLVFESGLLDGSQINIISSTYPELNKNIFLTIDSINANNVVVINGDISSTTIVSDDYIVDGLRNIKSDNVKQVGDFEVGLLALDEVTGEVHDISEYLNLESTPQNLGLEVVDKKLIIDTGLSPKTHLVNIFGPEGEFISNFDIEVLNSPINLTTRFNLRSSTGKFGTGKNISIEFTELSGKKIRIPLGVMNDINSWEFGLEASSQLFSSSGGRILIADKEVLDEIGPIGSSYRNDLLIEENLSNRLLDVCNVFEDDMLSTIIQCNSIP
ncbi:hypothetical protein ACPV5U_00260 [Vibrio mediterranei]